ncbi:MAG: DUF6502 family protein [Burkholderiaceae bacterium]
MDQSQSAANNHALEACERMLRPIMRLALDRGLKYQEIDELIRDLMLDEAARDWTKRNGKEPSGSQLSVTTGINRKEVKRRTDGILGPQGRKFGEQSLALVVFTAWRMKADSDASLETLPISDPSASLSFEKLARANVKDVHHRSLLDELIRLGLVRKSDETVTLAASTFVPPGTSIEMLEVLAQNTAAHLSAAVSNTAGTADPFLERAVNVVQITKEDCAELHRLAKHHWAQTRAVILKRMIELPTNETIPYQMRIGMYAYFEEMKCGPENSKEINS